MCTNLQQIDNSSILKYEFDYQYIDVSSKLYNELIEFKYSDKYDALISDLFDDYNSLNISQTDFIKNLEKIYFELLLSEIDVQL